MSTEPNQGIEESAIWSLAIDPQQPQTLYAGVWGKGLWRSSDGAQSWIQVSGASTNTVELVNTHAMVIAVDPRYSAHLFVTTMDNVGNQAGRPFAQSWEGGETWQAITAESRHAIVIAPTDKRHSGGNMPVA